MSEPNSEPNPPAGFEPLFRTSPFIDAVGPFFYCGEPDGSFVIGLRILPKHANSRGTAHGGLLMTLLDIALGYSTGLSQNPPAGLTTASLTGDFVRAPLVGEWVEARVDVQKVGGRLAFANAFLVVDGERVVRGSAVFARSGTSPSRAE